MTWVFIFFAATLVYLSFRSFRGGLEYLHYFKRCLSAGPSRYQPFATVIAPLRGVEVGLHENLGALLHQEYEHYEVLFVVDRIDDPAAAVVNGLLDKAKSAAKLIVAPKATAASQKIENLREAVLHADSRSQVFAFVDSDVRAGRQWLSHLVSPLADPTVGATTGYRWFLAHRPSFWTEVLSAWNASIASALGPNAKSNFCWGGSMAVRRELFDSLDIRHEWAGALSDDFAMTTALRKAGLDIVFVPQALSASYEQSSFAGVMEFTTRQIKITRVYSSNLWLVSLVGSAIFNGVMISAVLILIFGVASGPAYIAAVTSVVLITAFSIGKSWLRLSAVKLAMPEYERELNGQFWPQNTLWSVVPAIFLYNCIAAAISRRITWRGTTYELKSPTETVIIAD